MDKTISDRYTRYFAAAALVFSHQFFIVKELKLNRVYRIRWLLANKGPSPQGARRTSYGYNYKKTNSHGVQQIEEQLVRSHSGLPNIDKYLRFYYRFGMYYYGLLFVKYLLICSLELDEMQNFRFLGCYLLGRLLMNGRVTGFTNYFALFESFYLFLWRLLMLAMKRKHSLYCFEFLLFDYRKVVAREAKLTSTKHSQVWDLDSETKSKSKAAKTSYLSILQCKNSVAIEGAKLASDRQGSVGSRQTGRLAPMRLNRTSQQWRLLSQTLVYYWLCSLLFMFTFNLVLNSTIIPVLVTKRGFELSYHECFAWISGLKDNNDTSRQQYYSYIYSFEGQSNATTEASIILPMQDFTPLNVYHLARISVDYLENLFIYSDIGFLFVSSSAIAILVSEDVRHNCLQLAHKLDHLNDELRGLLQFQVSCESYGSSETCKSKPNNNLLLGRQYLHAKHQDELNARIQQTQSMLIDNFKLVGSYTKFASVLTLYNIASWLTYSAMVSKWLFVPGTELPKLEWYLVHLYRTVYVVLDLGSFARARNACRRLYPLIATSTSLDVDHANRKLRWLTILNFYSPRPMFCFRVLDSADLSWLFLLQLLTWLVSALVVASSFFGVYSLSRNL